MTHSVAVALISHTARNDVSSSLISIAQLCGDSQFTFFTNAHVQQALMKKNMLLFKYCVTFSKKCHLVPSFNNLASSNLELERLVAVQTAKKKQDKRINFTLKLVQESEMILPGVKFSAVQQSSSVVH
jgi:hypothetical protein